MEKEGLKVVFLLGRELYKVIKNVNEPLPIKKYNDDNFSVEVDDDDLIKLQFNLNEEIILRGLDKDYMPNKYGRVLYNLYDTIYEQIVSE